MILGVSIYITMDLKIENTAHYYTEKGTSEGWYHMKTKLSLLKVKTHCEDSNI